MSAKQFLDAQSADLNEAMVTLEDAIKRSTVKPASCWRHLQHREQAFRQDVPELFGGGQARLPLVMTGEEILDSGVQVPSRPAEEPDHPPALGR